MKNIKRISSIILCAITIVSSSTSIFASELKTIEKKAGYEIKTYDDQGVKVEVISIDDGVDKATVEKELEIRQSRLKAAQDEENKAKGISGNYSMNLVGTSTSNSNVKVFGTGYIHATTMSPFKIKVWGGNTTGKLNGTTPSKANQIYLRERYDFNGVGVSVSWPPGFSSSSSSDEWVSGAYPNEWYAVAYREQVSATCLLSTFSVTVQDGADMYIGSTCHKARASVKKGVWDWV